MNKASFQELKKKGYFCIDMHIHSNYSYDSDSNTEEIANKARHLGMGIALTDHNKIDGVVKICKSQKKLTIIPGIEVNSSEGLDILFYFAALPDLVDFYEKIILPNKKKSRCGDSKLSALSLLKESKNYNCLSVIAHPYRVSPRKILKFLFRRKKLKRIIEAADAIEKVNGKCSERNNQRAVGLAKRMGKPGVGGSDSHKIKTIGNVLTGVKSGKSASAVLDKIRLGKTIVFRN